MDITEFIRNRNITRHPWEITRSKIIQFLISKYNASCKHILDFGSGDAFVLTELCKQKPGRCYTAVDTAYTEKIVNDINNSTIKEQCNISFFQNLPETLYPESDCVLILDVLEHCENDDKILEELHANKQLHSSTFFITVPAFQTLFSKHDKLLKHYRRYNVNDLKLICKKNNFEIVECGYFFSSLIVLRIIQLFLEKLGLRNPKKSIDNWRGNKELTGLISGFLWISFIIENSLKKIGIQVPGLSAYCVCRPLPS